MIDLGREIVFRCDLLTGKRKDAGVAGFEERPVGQRVEGLYEAEHIGIDGDWAGGKIASASRRRWNGVHLRDAQRLTKALIRSEKISVILSDWPAGGGPKLVAAKWRVGAVEEIAGIQRAIADELECTAVKVIGAGASLCADEPAGGTTEN